MSLFDNLFPPRNGDKLSFNGIGYLMSEELAKLFRKRDDEISREDYITAMEELAGSVMVAALGSVAALQVVESMPDGTRSADSALAGLKSIAALQLIIGAAHDAGIGSGGRLTREKFLTLWERIAPTLKETMG